MRYGLHIGLCSVDPQSYAGWRGRLDGCEKDAITMMDLIMADKAYLLRTAEATWESVRLAIMELVSIAVPGDQVYISYSGHGTRLPDKSGDELDGMDEAWCLYDTLLIDDEIKVMLTKFLIGVQIYVFSDSCHSGTISKSMTAVNGTGDTFRPKYLSDLEVIQSAKSAVTKEKLSQVFKIKRHNTLTMSACQDEQISYDTPDGGLFTQAIKQSIRSGDSLNYVDLITAIRDQMPKSQTPRLSYTGSRKIMMERCFWR